MAVAAKSRLRIKPVARAPTQAQGERVTRGRHRRAIWELAPIVAGLASGVVAISAGEYHACALTQTGGVEFWGTYNNGLPVYRAPISVAGLASGVSRIAAGEFHTCALLAAGGVECWGVGGEMNTAGGVFASPTPAMVPGLGQGVSAIASGDGYACALLGSGSMECWGGNALGVLGLGSTTPAETTTPLPVSGLGSKVIALPTLGGTQTCALLQGGAVQCWGNNSDGQLGTGTSATTSSSSPTPGNVVGLTSGVSAIAAGGESDACAIVADGGVECWGNNEFGQLGDGTTHSSDVPVAVVGLNGRAVEIVTGDVHTCARMADHSVECWGSVDAVGCPRTATSACPRPVVISGL